MGSGNVISTYSGRSDASNYFSGRFTETIQAGDVILVSGGGVSIQYTAVGLDVSMDPVNDRAVGTTGAGRLVRADFRKRTWGYLETTCSWVFQCRNTTADGSGAFTLEAGLDLVRGDYATFYVYDGEGNYQYGQWPVPAIATYLDGQISGYWGDPSTGTITITRRASDGTVKETRSGVYVSSWSGQFFSWVWNPMNPIVPTDRVEVTDGTVTETMTVQSITARLDGGTGHLTGSAPDGHLVAELTDFRRDAGYSYGYCAETDVAGGAYDLAFSGAQVGGQDQAEVWSSGPDGHYTCYRDAYAFTVNAQEGDDEVYGRTETPHTPITITLERGGTEIAVVTTTSYEDGYYGVGLSDGTPVTITQGDILRVQTGDGDDVSLPIPELTANAGPVHNQVYGKSPADEPVQAEVRRNLRGWYYSSSQNTVADASGNYSASFAGLYWSRDCSPMDVGHRCAQPAACYYNDAGHLVWVEGPYPPPIGPDIYESDDISTTASAYTGIQSHTFHVVTDTDWVTFTVPQADVDAGVSYRIATFNLGWGMGTRVRLYDADMNLLGDWWGYEYWGGVWARWTPPFSGTYYLEISPPSSWYAAYCDAAYDLMVLPVRGAVYLPLVLRNR